MTLLDAPADLVDTTGLAVADLGAGSGPAWLDAWVTANASEIVATRRTIHAFPELGRTERRTTELLAARLLAAGLEPHTLPSGTGLFCDIGYGDHITPVLAMPEKRVPNGARAG